MLILTIRTDKPEAELGLYDDDRQLDYETWQAHRELAETIHQKMNDLLQKHAKGFTDVRGVVVFKGPGSFTGLRIGAAVGNALAASLHIPVCGTETDRWIELGVAALLNDTDDKVVVPEYGSLPNITPQRK